MIPLITKFNSNSILYDSLGNINESYISLYNDENNIYFLKNNQGSTVKYDVTTESFSAININLSKSEILHIHLV